MPIITLTTDWGLRDHYLASFKGEIISRSKGVQLIDISHQIEPFDILQASFIIQNCFDKFPAGTLHFIGISGNITQSNKNEKRNFLIVKCNGHIFTGEDSGIFSLILGDTPKEIYRLDISPDASSTEVYDRFISVITAYDMGKPIEEIGTPHHGLVPSFHTQPTVDHSDIRGAVIYIDSFGNVISNITRELFDKVGNGRPFVIFLRKSEYNIDTIHKNYFDVEAGEMVAFFNYEGYLELAMNHNSAEKMLQLKLMDTIRIEFN
jgi:S-adenosylmethionine hydrolase